MSQTNLAEYSRNIPDPAPPACTPMRAYALFTMYATFCNCLTDAIFSAMLVLCMNTIIRRLDRHVTHIIPNKAPHLATVFTCFVISNFFIHFTQCLLTQQRLTESLMAATEALFTIPRSAYYSLISYSCCSPTGTPTNSPTTEAIPSP